MPADAKNNPVVDPVATINRLRTRLDQARSDAATLQGRVQTLKEQYASRMKEVEAKYGCSTLDKLEEKIRAEEGSLRDRATLLQRMVDLYDSGDFDGLLSLAQQQTEPAAAGA